MEVAFIPKALIGLLTPNLARRSQLNILLSNLLLLFFFWYWKNQALEYVNGLPHVCLFQFLFHIGCPFCGSLRAFQEMAQGNFAQAWSLNGVSFFLGFYFILQIVFRCITVIYIEYIKYIHNLSKVLGSGLIIAAVLNWAVQLIVINH